jgi:hypothetical protein
VRRRSRSPKKLGIHGEASEPIRKNEVRNDIMSGSSGFGSAPDGSDVVGYLN